MKYKYLRPIDKMLELWYNKYRGLDLNITVRPYPIGQENSMKKSKSSIISVSIFRYFLDNEFVSQKTYVRYSSGYRRVISGLDVPYSIIKFKSRRAPAKVHETINFGSRCVYYFYD